MVSPVDPICISPRYIIVILSGKSIAYVSLSSNSTSNLPPSSCRLCSSTAQICYLHPPSYVPNTALENLAQMGGFGTLPPKSSRTLSYGLLSKVRAKSSILCQILPFTFSLYLFHFLSLSICVCPSSYSKRKW